LVLGWAVERLPGDQLNLIVQGLTYSAVYLVTGNLFICVGLHSLYNQPARLLRAPFSPGVQIVWHALVFVLLAGWPIARRFGARRETSIAEDKIA
ncbi:MAG TPA: hypothetical protein VMN36_09510, partial [Verrucomicrobiales bacterium]|nr:hypothetical protein [Verrucomicrobiales bacterium]